MLQSIAITAVAIAFLSATQDLAIDALGTQQVILVLIFIVVFRLGNAMVAKMAVPFLGDRGLGFSDTEIGNIRQGMGLIATIVGTLAGGSCLSKLGINHYLWIFGGLQAASNLAYYFL